MSTQDSTEAPDRGATLTVRVAGSDDAGRGICRLHPDALAVLRVRVWEPVHIAAGAGEAAALAGSTRVDSRVDVAVLDAPTAADLGVVGGDRILVTPVPATPARTVWLEPPEGIDLPPDAVRAALLGKAVLAGTRESLLPQDFSQAFSHGTEGTGAIRERLGPGWGTTRVRVSATEPAGVVLVAATTGITFGRHSGPERPAPTARDVTLSDVAGLDVQVAELRELLELPFRHQELLDRLGVSAPRGVLLQGPPGVGKSALARAVSDAVGVPVSHVDAVDLEGRSPEAAATELRRTLSTASQGVVLVEHVDRIAPVDGETRPTNLESVFLRLLDEALTRGAVVVATTSDPDGCAPALFSPGRLERRIELPAPDRRARRDILHVHTRGLPLGSDVDLEQIAAKTPGYVGADLRQLCREAAVAAAARLKDGSDEDRRVPTVMSEDFLAALSVVRPSALSERVDTGDTTWADVGNAEATKRHLTESVLWPVRYPETFTRLGVAPPRGVLLYGPPGTGKTFLVRALANEAEANLVAVNGAELLSKWVGESEAGVREVFRRARAAAPTILFLDEVDALAPRRGGGTTSGVSDRVVAQLLTEIDGIEPMRGVAVVAATNRPDLVDPALLRPGRIERHVFVSAPDREARVAILAATTRNMPLDGVDLEELAALTDDYSAADLAALAREAGISAMTRDAAAISVIPGDFRAALERVRASIDPATVEALRTFGTGNEA